jgi:hypothetical protein
LNVNSKEKSFLQIVFFSKIKHLEDSLEGLKNEMEDGSIKIGQVRIKSFKRNFELKRKKIFFESTILRKLTL